MPTPYHAPMPDRALLVYNPAARGAPALDSLRSAIASLAGWQVDLESTAGPGDATELARGAAAREFSAVVACGGDGTVNEVANGLAGSRSALAVVRGGTANVWSKETHLPKDPAAAIAILAEGRERVIDLGRARWAGGERYFLLMAGVGLDAAIVRGVSSGLKRRIGAAAYIVTGLRRAVTFRTVDADLRVDGEATATGLYWLLAGNTRSYAGLLDITLDARVDDGALDVAILQRGGLHRLAWLLPWVLLRRHRSRKHVLYRTARELAIETPGLPVQIDGESLGETPMRFDIAPGALRVLVPRDLASPLFGH